MVPVCGDERGRQRSSIADLIGMRSQRRAFLGIRAVPTGQSDDGTLAVHSSRHRARRRLHRASDGFASFLGCTTGFGQASLSWMVQAGGVDLDQVGNDVQSGDGGSQNGTVALTESLVWSAHWPNEV
jgi:hypothetical protein